MPNLLLTSSSMKEERVSHPKAERRSDGLAPCWCDRPRQEVSRRR